MSKNKIGNLIINSVLLDFINKEVIPGTDVLVEDFWNKFDSAVHELAPINKGLIDKRESIQKKIDAWHLANKGKETIKSEYNSFLKDLLETCYRYLRDVIETCKMPCLYYFTHSLLKA